MSLIREKIKIISSIHRSNQVSISSCRQERFEKSDEINEVIESLDPNMRIHQPTLIKDFYDAKRLYLRRIV